MELDYIIHRSAKRSKLTITVERDRQVVVHAPIGTSEQKIHEIVLSKRQWIREKIGHPQKYQDLPHPPGKELVNGESALYLGRQYQIEVVSSDHQEVVFTQRFLIPSSQVSKRKVVLRDWYIARAEEKLGIRVKRRARELGVEYRSLKIVDNRYRWGSCTPKNNINLNWRLIKAPMWIIDYVIVHELVHLMEPNHTERFWSIVRTHSVNMEKAKSWLKANGELLEQEI